MKQIDKRFFLNSIILSLIVFGGIFLFAYSAQGGTVQFGDKNIFVDFNGLPFDLSNWVPGMSSSPKTIAITNNEDFDMNVYFGAKKTSDDEVLLADVLTITIDGKSNHLSDLFDNNITLGSVNSGESQNYSIVITFDQDAGNEYQNKSINFDFIIIAGQTGGEVEEVIIPGGGGGVLPPGLTINAESVRITSVEETSVTITWTTSYFSTSQVIYARAGEKHNLDLTDNLGTPPKYGYANTTPESDTSPKVTFHSVTIYGLNSGTTYYYRTVSQGSLAISQEYSFTTKGIGEVILPVPTPTPIPTPTFTPGPTPAPEVGITPETGITPPKEVIPPQKIVTIPPEGKVPTGGLAPLFLASLGVIGETPWMAILATFCLIGLVIIVIRERELARKKKKNIS